MQAQADTDQDVRLTLQGLHCAGCVRSVERALGEVEGVTEARVNLVEEVATVRLRAGEGDVQALLLAVEDAGYGAELLEDAPVRVGVGEGTDQEESRDESHQKSGQDDGDQVRIRAKFRVGMALGLPVVLIGHLDMIPGLPPLADGVQQAAWWLSALLTLPILVYVGGDFFVGAWKALKRCTSNMDTLVALGTGAAWLYSTVAVFFPQLFPTEMARPFYEAVAVVITLVVLGQGLEAKAKGKTARALRALFDLAPDTADRFTANGDTETIPLAEVRPGDRLRVRPGARLPLDGTVISGESDVNEAMLTGESAPVVKQAGDEVTGGTVNGTGVLTIQATRVGADTFLARIAEMVRRAQATKPPVQQSVDKVASYFVPAVLMVALTTFGLWYFAGSAPRMAAVTSVAVLVIACPCALGLATPVSVMIAIGKAARHGVLIRSGEALQSAWRVTTVVLDKTGTLTEGKPAVADATFAPVRVGDKLLSERDILELAASAEVGSEHPLARAINVFAKDRGAGLRELKDFVARPGQGVTAEVDGCQVVVGRPTFVESSGTDLAPLGEAVQRMVKEGATPVVVGIDGQAAVIFGVVDTVRREAAQVVAALKRRGLRVVMLTGDEEAPALRVAKAVGVEELRAQVPPERKAQVVRSLHQEGQVVAMVGDGINDAPALAEADVGIAMGGGTEVALQSGDIALLGDSLVGIETLFTISKAANRNIAQNLIGAFTYNVVGIPIAAGALYSSMGLLLNPMIAGAAMAFSSVTVVANANRLRNLNPVPQVQ